MPFELVNSDTHNMVEKDMFMDEKLILDVVEALKLQDLLCIPKKEDEMKSRKLTLNIINAFFEKNSANENNVNLYSLREVLLSSSRFK